MLHAGASRAAPGLEPVDDPTGRRVATVGWRRDLALAYLLDAAPTLISDQAACDWWVRSVRLTLSPSGKDRGAHSLKGIAEPWQLYAVTR